MSNLTNNDEIETPIVDDDENQRFSIGIYVPPEATEEEFEAITAISSTAAATMAIAKLQRKVCPVPNDLSAMAALLEVQSKSNGTGEEILQTQAKTLDLLFSQLLNRAMDETNTRTSEQLLRLAFKAQAQSRATLTAISDIRHPRITNNIAQVNNSTGNQQINNEMHAHVHGEFCKM